MKKNLETPSEFERYITEQVRQMLWDVDKAGSLDPVHGYVDDLQAKVSGWQAAVGHAAKEQA